MAQDLQTQVDNLTSQLGVAKATISSLQNQVATFQADIQTATLTMESSYNDLATTVAKLYALVNQFVAQQTSSQ